MKKLFIFLLLANAAVFGYAYYERYNSEAQAASDRYKPVNADQVRVLTTQQISKLGPAKVAQLTLACAEWGPSPTDQSNAGIVHIARRPRCRASRRTNHEERC